MKKSTIFFVIAIHTTLILLVFPYRYLLSSKEESWPFFFTFFIDFPVSILFQMAISLLKEYTNNISTVSFWWLTFSHFFLGAVWWLMIAAGITKLTKIFRL
jgi:hypothetical protein